jgi:uncharacterized protein YegL
MSKNCPNCGQEVPNKDLHIIFVLDESGSMSSIWDATIDAVNEFINAQKAEEGKTWISLIKFDTEFRVLYCFTPLEDVAPLTNVTYSPRGLTALHDAIGKTINEHKANKNVNTLFVVMTDGQENASKEFNLTKVQTAINEQKKAGWNFSFLGANIDSYAVGGNYGFDTTVNWKPNAQGVHSMTKAMASYGTSARSGVYLSSVETQCLVDDADKGSEA